MLGALGKLLGRLENTVNNDVRKPIQRNIPSFLKLQYDNGPGATAPVVQQYQLPKPGLGGPPVDIRPFFMNTPTYRPDDQNVQYPNIKDNLRPVILPQNIKMQSKPGRIYQNADGSFWTGMPGSSRLQPFNTNPDSPLPTPGTRVYQNPVQRLMPTGQPTPRYQA